MISKGSFAIKIYVLLVIFHKNSYYIEKHGIYCLYVQISKTFIHTMPKYGHGSHYLDSDLILSLICI